MLDTKLLRRAKDSVLARVKKEHSEIPLDEIEIRITSTTVSVYRHYIVPGRHISTEDILFTIQL